MENSRVHSIVMHAGMIGVLTMTSLQLMAQGRAPRVAVAPSVREQTTLQRVTVNIENAPLPTALRMIAQQAGLIPVLNESILPAGVRVTLHMHDVAVPDALQQALRGTGLMANILAEGNVTNVTIVHEMKGRIVGTIVGRVTDAKTQRPLREVKIEVDGTDYRARTGDSGTYRLANVSVGSYTVTAKLLGYAKTVRAVTIQDNTTTTVDMMLDASVTPLEQVVVTGTIIPTELKAVPNAITVITAKQIEERGITRIDQLFRGEVPGVFAENQGSGADLGAVAMFSRGATKLPQTDDFRYPATNPIKTYVDGVELADPSYMSQLDPKSIERIEILTGPQASTIYGSNAINGVMQIFTKRGVTAKPQLTFNLLSGWVENNFSTARTPQHDVALQTSGMEGHLAYNAGTSLWYTGPWTPRDQTTRTSGFGGTHLQLGALSVNVNTRLARTRQKVNGAASQASWVGASNGAFVPGSAAFGGIPAIYALDGQTAGLTLTYAPIPQWSSEFGLGTDVSDLVKAHHTAGYTVQYGTSDTLLLLEQGHYSRTSVRYTTTTALPLGPQIEAFLTGGIDGWHTDSTSLRSQTQTLTGALTGTPSVIRRTAHNTGAFFQGQLGVKDALFLTYGLRAEWNPNYGANVEPNLAPRYGIAYTHSFDLVTAKWRASYGRSTRPPTADQKLNHSLSVIEYWQSVGAAFIGEDVYAPAFGNVTYLYANPDLNPERQQGVEVGTEVYFGSRGSLTVTRYNQTVADLIAMPYIDSTQSLIPDPFGYCTFYPQYCGRYLFLQQYQYANVGSIRNQGWEVRGTLRTGPIMTAGTYSWTKSRSMGVTPKYRAQYGGVNAGYYAQLQPGASFSNLPEHTWELSTTYGSRTTIVALNLSGIGRLYRASDALTIAVEGRRLMLDQPRTDLPDRYRSAANAYVMADCALSHQIMHNIEGLLQIQNLTNTYPNDVSGLYASIGRQTKVGIRVR